MKNKVLSAFLGIAVLTILVINSTTSVEAAKSYGGSLYNQRGYIKKNGTYVQPHLKTKPDNTIYNNRKYRLGY